jgi:hypothetical protein
MTKWWILGLLTVAIALGVAVACASGGDDDDDNDDEAQTPDEFCDQFCAKCAACVDESAGWDDNDCRYEAAEGAFTLADCMAGCEAGAIPFEVPRDDFPEGWEGYSCTEFDDFL